MGYLQRLSESQAAEDEFATQFYSKLLSPRIQQDVTPSEKVPPPEIAPLPREKKGRKTNDAIN
jgi:hypothetical protein